MLSKKNGEGKLEPYERAHVVVDSHFARFGSKSYAINKITSVEVRSERKERNFWLLLAIVAVVFMLIGIQPLIEQGNPLALIFGLGLAVPAALLFRSRTSWSHYLILATASGEVQATMSTDQAAIEELREAIEARIADAKD